MRVVLWVLTLFLATTAQADSEFRSHVSYPLGGLQATLINFEQPRDKPYLIVHFEIKNPSNEDLRCDWSALVSLRKDDGSSMNPNYDALVDSGGGLTRATGPFVVPGRDKVKASLLFVLGPGDLPGQLHLPDGRLSVRIQARGQAQWNR